MIGSYFAKLGIVKKIITMLVTISSISILMTAMAFISFEYYSAQKHLHDHVKLLNAVVSENVVAAVAFEDKAAITELLTILKADKSILYAQVTDIKGNALSDYGTFSPDMKTAHGESLYVTNHRALKLDGEDVGGLYIVASKADFYSRISGYFMAAGFVLISALIIATLIAYFMHRRLSMPILALSKMAKKVTDNNDYTLRVDIKDKDEIGDLACAFNTMLDQVEIRKDQLEGEVLKRTLELEQANEKLSKLAFYDNLTGLPNRVLLEERLSQAIIRNHRVEREIVLLFIDLDGFKLVNDSFGHEAGDVVLIGTANHLIQQCREQDTVARLGGDEFIMLLELQNDEDIALVCQRIINNFNLYAATNEVSALVTLSVGAAIYNEHSLDFDTLKNQADAAMYQVKQKGKNGFQVYGHLRT